MKYIIIISMSAFISVQSSEIKMTAGGTYEVLQTRYADERTNQKTNVFVEGKKENIRMTAERRKERNLLSAEWKNDLFYVSAGHRYKPIYGFYFLRDRDFYSAFQNPSAGIIEQPLHRSFFSGLHRNGFGTGLFYGKDFSEKEPGIYVHSPENILGAAYSTERKLGFFSLNLRDWPFMKKSNSPKLTVSSQGQGNRKKNFGYLNARLFFPEQSLETEASLYKEDRNSLFVTANESRGTEDNTKGMYLKISRNHYDRIEYYQGWQTGEYEKIIGGNAAFFSGNRGAVCAGGRVYRNFSVSRYTETGALSISYEYRLNSSEFMLRTEKREIGDLIGELKLTYRPEKDWKFEISSLVQKEGNRFRSVFEQWSDGENINTILTDRTFAFKLKLTGTFIVLNLSGSRKKEGKGEAYFMNVQFKTDF